MRPSCLRKNKKRLKDAMLKGAAFLPTQAKTHSTFERELLHEKSIFFSLFTRQKFEVAIERWSWLIKPGK